MNINYQIETDLKYEEFKSILINSILSERRPINEVFKLKKMIENSNLIITARENGKLVGLARSLTDYQFCTYLSDLAVDKKYQNRGIGKELIKRTKNEVPNTMLILLSAPNATAYYPKIGMTKFEHCYVLKDINDLT
jgi:predicted N-acetyltransferase YhbS